MLRRLDAIDSFHTFAVVDACFSGALFTTYKSVTPGYENKRSRWGLAASHSRERALDGTARENSPFAATLLHQLRGSRDNLPVQDLAAAVIRQVEQATQGRQLPTDEEWKALAMKFGGYHDWEQRKDVGDPKKAYSALLEGGNSGFSWLLGGYRDADGSFGSLGHYGYDWSATEYGTDYAWLYYFYRSYGQLYRLYDSRSLGFSCRCVQD